MAALLAGSMLLCLSQSAQAGQKSDRVSFREFRQNHAGLDRFAARQQFRSERREDRSIKHQIPVQQIVHDTFQEWDIIDRCGTNELPVNGNQLSQFSRAVGRQSIQQLDGNRSVRLSSGVVLDLTSSSKNITLGQNLFSSLGSVEITSGGQSRTVGAGSQVSAAEYIAVKQVLSGSGQKVSIDKTGRASGGDIDFGAIIQSGDAMRAASLVVSENVTTSGDFGRHSEFKLTGDLTNYGTVNAFSSDSNVKQGAIRARDITNQEGGSINSRVDLTLDAAGRLINKGSINVDGKLTVYAGESLENTGSMSATSDTNLLVSNINNKGVIASASGNVNVQGLGESDVFVNNQDGSIAALQGAINVRDVAYAQPYASAIYGGNLLSRELNLHSGSGFTTIDVNEITGVVNETGTTAHVLASTDNLRLGSICLSGDPTFYNTSGDITITGDVLVAENLVFAAAGSIIVNAANTIAAGDANGGFDITFIAGADFTANGGTDSPTIPPTTNSGAISLSGKTSKLTGGGTVEFGTGCIVSSRSTDLTGNKNAGSIAVFAFGSKKNPISGIFNASSTSFLTGGSNLGANGDVVIVAGGPNGTVLTTGVIDTTGGTGSGGDVLLVTAPIISSEKGEAVEYNAGGNRTSTAFLLSDRNKISKNAEIRIGNPIPSTDLKVFDDLTIIAGRSIQVEADTIVNDGAFLRSGGSITSSQSSPFFAGSVLLQAAVSLDGDVGSESNPLQVETARIGDVSGNSVFIKAFGSASTPATFIDGEVTASDTASITALPGLALNSTAPITAPRLLITADSFGVMADLIASDQLVIAKTGAGPLTNASFDNIVTSRLRIEAAADIGLDANNRFVLPDGLEEIALVNTGASGGVFATSLSDMKLNVDIAGQDAVEFSGNGSLNVINVDSLSASVNVTTSAGTLSLSQSGTAATSFSFTNTALDKGKIALLEGVNISAELGDVLISLGPTGPITSSFVPTNLTVSNIGGGTAFFTGSQKAVDAGLVKAKGTNNIDLLGNDVTINNGTDKTGSFTLSGVSISADD